jgi:hypothetical protein
MTDKGNRDSNGRWLKGRRRQTDPKHLGEVNLMVAGRLSASEPREGAAFRRPGSLRRPVKWPSRGVHTRYPLGVCEI